MAEHSRTTGRYSRGKSAEALFLLALEQEKEQKRKLRLWRRRCQARKEQEGGSVCKKLFQELALEDHESYKQQRRILWTKEAETSLIEKVREYPELWDITNPHYLKKTLRRQLFTVVARYLMDHHPSLGELTADHVRLKFGNLRAYYIKEKKKQMKLSGLGGIPTSKWELFSLLTFLDSVGTEVTSICSLQQPSQALSTSSLDAEDGCLILNVDSPEIIDCSGDESTWRVDGEENMASHHSEASSSSSSTTTSGKQKRVYRKTEIEAPVPNYFEELKKVMDQDFEYGIGLAVSNQLRTMPEEKKILCATKVLQIIHDMKFKE